MQWSFSRGEDLYGCFSDGSICWGEDGQCFFPLCFTWRVAIHFMASLFKAELKGNWFIAIAQYCKSIWPIPYAPLLINLIPDQTVPSLLSYQKTTPCSGRDSPSWSFLGFQNHRDRSSYEKSSLPILLQSTQLRPSPSQQPTPHIAHIFCPTESLDICCQNLSDLWQVAEWQ